MTTTADFPRRDRISRPVGLGSLHGDADPQTLRRVACGRLMLAATDPVTFAHGRVWITTGGAWRSATARVAG